MKQAVKLLTAAAACLIAAATACVQPSSAIESAAEMQFANAIVTEIDKINAENLDSGSCFVMELSVSDYMTATEWNNYNYKWYNCEKADGTNISLAERVQIDLTNNNLCNFVFDQNLSEYNFEESILINGQTLAEFSKTNPYKMVGNKRTRVDTLSLDFTAEVMKTITSVTLLPGCQLPTLSYAYVNDETSSCLLLEEGVQFEKRNGVWVKKFLFDGYVANESYNADEKMCYLTMEKTYKGHEAVPMESFTDFFDFYKYPLGGGLVAGERHDGFALASGVDTQKGKIVVFELVNPIDAELFPKMYLRAYTNHKRTLYSYNTNDVTESTLGERMEVLTLGGGCFTYMELTTALYANKDGMVESIVFEFAEDGEPTLDANGNEIYVDGALARDQLFFMSFYLQSNEDSNIKPVTNASLIIEQTDEAYEINFRFNVQGNDNGVALDKTKVLINGTPISEMDVTASWRILGRVYQIDISIPKSYEGEGQLRNADSDFIGNNIAVLKGLQFPDGSTLDKTYSCHWYSHEKQTACEMVENYGEVSVTGVDFDYVADSENLHFTIYFDKEITSAPYYHACESEQWRLAEIGGDPTIYDAGVVKAFVDGGFKAALLDCIYINGKSIGDWHAHDPKMPANVMVHYTYGNAGLNSVNVYFDKLCPNTYNELQAAVETGDGVTVEVRSGMKFTVNLMTTEDQTFVMKNGSFEEVREKRPMSVYYNGAKVENGTQVTVQTTVGKEALYVECDEEYQISEQTTENGANYTITYGEGQTFTFSVAFDLAPVEEESGCGSAISGFALSTVALAAVAIVGRRKKNEE